MHRHRHVAGRAPAHHRVVLRRARPEHLALAVTRPDHHRDARAQPELGRGDRLQLADDGVGRHDAGQLAERRAGQLPYGVAVEVVEATARGEGRVGHHLVGHAEHDEVARATGSGRRPRAVRARSRPATPVWPHGAGVERDAGAGPVDVVATHALGEGARLGRRRDGRTTRCPSRLARPRRHGDEGLSRPRTGDDVHLVERLGRLGARLGAGDHERRPPAQRVLLRPAHFGVGRGELRTRQRDEPSAPRTRPW